MRIKGILNILPDSSKLLLATSVWLTMMVFASVLSAVAIDLFYGLNVFKHPELMNDYTNPDIVPALKLMQILSSVITFIVAAFLIVMLFENSVLDFLGLNKLPKFGSALAAFLLIFALAPVINLLVEWNSNLHLPSALKSVETWMQSTEEQASNLTDAFLGKGNINDLFINIFIIALIPALGEELFFRGVMQNYFVRIINNKHVAIIVSAIIFSAVHLQFYGFIPRMMLGIILGYLYVWSGSLWLPVLAHFVNNASSVVFTYISQHRQLDFNPDTVGTKQGEIVWIIASVILSIACMFVIQFQSKQNQKNSGFILNE